MFGKDDQRSLESLGKEFEVDRIQVAHPSFPGTVTQNNANVETESLSNWQHQADFG